MSSTGWFATILIGSMVFLTFVVPLFFDLLRYLFPCSSHGPFMHKTTPIVNDETTCLRCFKSWRIVEKHYSLASDGDPDSYIPEWELITPTPATPPKGHREIDAP